MQNKELIPKGDYCYSHIEKIEETGDLTLDLIEIIKFKVKLCPYFKTKDINGVKVYWCDYLNKGGLPNEEIDFQKLVEFYGSEDILYDELSLSLLFDQVKECGERIVDVQYDDLKV